MSKMTMAEMYRKYEQSGEFIEVTQEEYDAYADLFSDTLKLLPTPEIKKSLTFHGKELRIKKSN